MYNVVVIGGGTAGLVAAAGAAGLGAKVALVEKHLLGGDCLNVGCVPSKCLIRSSRVLADVRDAGAFGVEVPAGAEVDFPAVMERMRRLRARISYHDAIKKFVDLGVDIFLGAGRFSGPDTVEVAGKTLRFKKAVIATGARAVRPQVEGLEEAGFLTNETVFSLTECPSRLAVFGAGPLGCELAQAFQRLGSEVTVIEMGPHMLSREDPDAADIIAEAFRRDGINVMLNSKATRVETSNDGKVICLETGGKESSITVDEILVGAGRAPNVEGLNLEAVGVEYDDHKGVIVDDYLRTTNSRIYAAGDICLRFKFTHTADATARIVLQNALFKGRKKLSALTVPWCTYTDPEIAHVGMYEKDAQERGIAVQTFARPLKDVDRAIADGEEEGLIKIHVREGSDKILGATIIARHAGEMISEITLAIIGGVGLKTLSGVIHPYPTQAEVIRQVADDYNRTRLTPRIKKLFSWWLARQRR
jgi:pyruvate/2-oxoglutarate dehydrogenase complex dihydrolipoamide dehydrogenase (E3) component